MKKLIIILLLLSTPAFAEGCYKYKPHYKPMAYCSGGEWQLFCTRGDWVWMCL